MKDARVLLECGAYEGERPKREVEFSYQCWELVYAFVSLGPEDYKPVLVENPKLRPFCVEFEPKHVDVERQAALTSQPSSPSHPDEQSKEDELADAEDEEPFKLDDILKNDALERLGNKQLRRKFKNKQVDGGTDLDPNLLFEVEGEIGLVPIVHSEVGGGTDLVPYVPSELGGRTDLVPTLPSEVEKKTDEVPTLPSDFISRGGYDSNKERSAAKVTKGIEIEEHHGEVPIEHTDEHQEPSEQANAPSLLA
ncbi:hypothetical protein R1sor_014942 [Riccia sorocarpa]|uniref:Uncharacterized protein n=1 Tax=Riccia sorocarpa TaxID=122646 RepID=A0ABD3HB53_9MARC